MIRRRLSAVAEVFVWVAASAVLWGPVALVFVVLAIADGSAR